MARIRLSPESRLSKPITFHRSDAREKMREKFKDLPRPSRKLARQEINREIQRETFKRAFKGMGAERAGFLEKKEAQYNKAKLAAVKRWMSRDIKEGKVTEGEVYEIAERSTLHRVSGIARRREESLYVLAYRKGKVMHKGKDRKGNKLPLYRYQVWNKKRRAYITVGKPMTTGQVRQRIGSKAYWARIRSLKNALGLRSMSEARTLDRRMLEVPERLRRQIYEKVLRKYAG